MCTGVWCEKESSLCQAATAALCCMFPALGGMLSSNPLPCLASLASLAALVTVTVVLLLCLVIPGARWERWDVSRRGSDQDGCPVPSWLCGKKTRIFRHQMVVLWCMLLCVVQHPVVVLANPDPALLANALTYCFWTKEGVCCLGIRICHVLPSAKANPSPASQRWCRCHCAPISQTCTWHCHCSLPHCCCSEPGLALG